MLYSGWIKNSKRPSQITSIPTKNRPVVIDHIKSVINDEAIWNEYGANVIDLIKNKCKTLEDFIDILKNKKCNFINLQYGDVESEIKSFKEEYDIDILTIDNLDLFNDFDKLAAVLKNLDLFISVSNTASC